MDAELPLEKNVQLFNLIKPICAKWKEIAARLGLKNDTIQRINTQCDEPERALNMVILDWLCGKDASKQKGITLSSLAKALKHSSVNEPELASKVKQSVDDIFRKKTDVSRKKEPDKPLRPQELFRKYFEEIVESTSDPETYVIGQSFCNVGLISSAFNDSIMTNKSLDRFQRASQIFREVEKRFTLADGHEVIRKVSLVLWKQENQLLKKVANIFCKDMGINFQSVEDTVMFSDLNDTHIQRFQQHLKNRYIIWSKEQKKAWPPTVVADYVNLEIIEANPRDQHTIAQKLKTGSVYEVTKHGSTILLKDVLSCSGKKSLTLIEGAPGIGKTTAANKICKDWAQGTAFTNYDLVIYIPLNFPKLKVANSLPDLLEWYGVDCEVHVIEYIRKYSGKGVLFVLDGWDELHQSSRDENMFLPRLIKGDFLPHMTTLVTSRPMATYRIRSPNFCHLSKVIQIVGFTNENIMAYVRSYFVANPLIGESLLEELHKYPNIMSACYVAINCTIICYVYEMNGNKLPNTLTEVYYCFVLHAVKRSINKSDEELQKVKELQATSLDEFSGTRYNMIFKICELALKELLSSNFSFKRNSFQEFCEVSSDDKLFDGFGLVQFYDVPTARGPVSYAYFLHLTIQEFLAAYFISKQEANKQCEIFGHEHNIMKQHPLVVKFFYGLCENHSQAMDMLRISDVSQLLLVECVYETQSDEKCKLIAKWFSCTLKISDCSLQPYQALACGNVMIKSGKRWKVEWNNAFITETALEILQQCFKIVPPILSCILVQGSEFQSQKALQVMLEIVAYQNMDCKQCDCKINGQQY